VKQLGSHVTCRNDSAGQVTKTETVLSSSATWPFWTKSFVLGISEIKRFVFRVDMVR
jgi:hypothetical protein